MFPACQVDGAVCGMSFCEGPGSRPLPPAAHKASVLPGGTWDLPLMLLPVMIINQSGFYSSLY